ncbi:TadE/TadG family type IV pilus assembly protein [Polynucleobacter arcticus]
MLKKLCKDQSGSAVVEFAIVLPTLLLLVFGAINYGAVFNNQLIINAAAREGARWAALYSDSSTVCSTTGATNPCKVASDYMQSGLLFASETTLPTYTWTAANTDTNTLQTVHVTYTYSEIGWSIPGLKTAYSATSSALHQ